MAIQESLYLDDGEEDLDDIDDDDDDQSGGGAAQQVREMNFVGAMSRYRDIGVVMADLVYCDGLCMSNVAGQWRWCFRGEITKMS